MFNPYEDLNFYFNFHQRMVILSLLEVAKTQKSKTVNGINVLNKYIELCDQYGIECIFERHILDPLKSFEVAGFIKIKTGMKITKLDLGDYSIDQWIEAIYQDPEFKKYQSNDV